jgi:sulfate permease, SulP family
VLGRVPGAESQFVDIARHPENQPVPGIVVLRVEGGLFFANAETVRRAVLAQATEGTRAIVLDAETVPYVDVTAAQALVELAEELERRGVRLVLARDVGQVRDLLGKADATLETYPSVRAAVAALER